MRFIALALPLGKRLIAAAQSRVIIVCSAFIIGFSIRACLAIYGGENFDLFSYAQVVKILQRCGIVYQETQYYNYSPFWSYWLLGCSFLAEKLFVAFPAVVRLSLAAADMVNAIMVYQITRRLTGSMVPFLFYCFNPATIIVSSLHGQFDVLAMLPILIALDFHLRGKPLIVIWALGTLAVVIKQIVLFTGLALFVYSARNWRRAVLMILGTGVVFLLTLLPFRAAGPEIFANVFGHSGATGWFGITRLIGEKPAFILFLVIMSVLPFIFRHLRHLPLIPALFSEGAAFLVFAPGLFPQYATMAVVCGALLMNWQSVLLSVTSAMLMLGYHFGFKVLLPMGHFTWPLSIFAVFSLAIRLPFISIAKSLPFTKVNE